MTSIMKMLGIPVPDKEGTFQVKVEEIDGEVRLSADGTVFAKCCLKDRAIMIQIIDVDSGVVCERNIQTLCWRR